MGMCSSYKPRVLVVSTSRKTRGGITAVLQLYEQSVMWHEYHCHWTGTHRDGSIIRKVWYLMRGYMDYLFRLPFYDIVHFHFSLPTTAKRKFPLFLLAKLLGKKTVIHLHCGQQIDDIWNSRYQYMFKRCDCGILLSESLRGRILDYIGQTDKLKVIFNPCPIIKDNTAYEKQNKILFSGTLYEGKGYKDLIKAFSLIANNHRDWRLVLAGNGELGQARSLAEELGVSEQVDLLGWVKGESKHRVFCESKLLCLPSYAEGFPMAVLDAWAYGIPVITTPVGGIPDIAEDGKNMLLFNPGDINQLSDCLERMITNQELRESISKESVHLAKTTFNVNTICEEVAALYDDIIRNN